MNVEIELCVNLSTVFQSLLPGLEIEGNWAVDESYLKGVDTATTEKLEINVSPRKYDGYTSRMAEFSVSLEGEFSLADDASFARTTEVYELMVGKLDEWHGDITAVKRDLSVSEGNGCRFDPVGFRLDGGNVEIDRDTKTRHITQQFTIKGRIS